jgi:hypothetical protein
VRLVDIYPTTAMLLGAGTDDPVLRQLDGRVLDSVRFDEKGCVDRAREIP